MEEIVDGEDRISELPIQIIHDILRRIRRHQYGLKEEARICILSKTWSSIWRSRPEVIIDQSIHKSFRNSTEKFVDDSLRSHVEQNLRIEMLRLINLRLPELASHIDRWLNLAIKHNVRSLEISLACNFSYSIPDAIYGAKTLTELSLNKCNFEINNSNSTTTNKLQGIFSTCRDLKIGRCTGIQNLHVFGLVNLEKLELSMCKKLEKVEIWAPNLRQFVFVGALWTSTRGHLNHNRCLVKLIF
ncbi:putative F-box/FBD/LRR-repeat protein At4g03220 [Nicotiana tabacum]|uniref:F-box/FBD/LRR-repeat protein At4g03220 n=2 Tax=Nicotiana TaxID=4085 RepID=A0A1S3ZU82_TOBAC|nr:PREDICTED: putative FBD-associated F-box protein At5g22720 [Nicotiana sylvestris]XP_016467878.1 PREDICTED: putative FBD-associated F-box protein At5g22720 [Nicotiana tabacum]